MATLLFDSMRESAREAKKWRQTQLYACPQWVIRVVSAVPAASPLIPPLRDVAAHRERREACWSAPNSPRVTTVLEKLLDEDAVSTSMRPGNFSSRAARRLLDFDTLRNAMDRALSMACYFQLWSRVRFVSNRMKQIAQRPPQTVHLVDQIEDHADPLIVDAQVLLQVFDEVCARDVDFGELLAGRVLARNQPLFLDPYFQRFDFKAGAD
jgi:hypothetical protein